MRITPIQFYYFLFFRTWKLLAVNLNPKTVETSVTDRSVPLYFFFLIKKFVVILHTDCVDVLRVAEEREVLCFTKIGLPHCWMGVMLLSAVLNTEPRLRFTWSLGSGLPQALCVPVWWERQRQIHARWFVCGSGCKSCLWTWRSVLIQILPGRVDVPAPFL